MKKSIKTKYIQKLASDYDIGDQYWDADNCGCTNVILAHVPEITSGSAYIALPIVRCQEHLCICKKDLCTCKDPRLLAPLFQDEYNMIMVGKKPEYEVEYTLKRNPLFDAIAKDLLSKFEKNDL